MSNHNSSNPNRFPRTLTAAISLGLGISAYNLTSNIINDVATTVECEIAAVNTTTSDTIDSLMKDVDGKQTGAASDALAKLVQPQPIDTKILVCSSNGNVSATALTDGSITYTVTNEGYATTDTVEPNS